MTISNTITKTDSPYACNGAATEFDTLFKFISASDIEVYLLDGDNVPTLLTLNIDYTVSGGNGETGVVTTLTTYPSPYKIYLVRTTDTLQNLDLIMASTYHPDRLEHALDKLTMLTQEIKRTIELCFRLTNSDVSGASTALPTPEANKTLKWNSSADALENAGIEEFANLIQASNFITNTFVAGTDYTKGTTTALSLSTTPQSISNTQVYFDGAYKSKNDYTLDENIVTFNAEIDADLVEIVVIEAVPHGSTVIPDSSITEGKIASLAVSNGKLAANAVSEIKILDRAITLAKLALGTQGGLMYYGSGGVPSALAAGTSGYFLKTQGAGADPTWGQIPNASTVVKGLMMLATAAEARGFSVADEAISPATLKNAFEDSRNLLAANGYQYLPNGFLLKWGKVTGITENEQIVTFPTSGIVAFTVAPYIVVPIPIHSSNNRYIVIDSSYTITTTRFKVLINSSTSSPGISMFWFAIGK